MKDFGLLFCTRYFSAGASYRCQRCLCKYVRKTVLMKLRGGYNILLHGRPERAVKVLPEPDVLYLPLRSQRFGFSEVCVNDGQRVDAGDILAHDPDNYAVPLLAPRAGIAQRPGLSILQLQQS